MTIYLRLLKMTAMAAAALVLALAVAQQPASPASAAFTDTDGDGVIDLAEVITGSNPKDAASTPEDTGVEFLTGFPVCSDGADNDRDGRTDAADSGCLDSDGDIASDALETLLGSDPFATESFPESSSLDEAVAFYGFPIFTCADGFDNDGDGLTDEDDPGCEPLDSDDDGFGDALEKRFGSDPFDDRSEPEHEGPHPGSCDDNRDNDRDGDRDGADDGCRNANNGDFGDAREVVNLPYTDSGKIEASGPEHGEPRSRCAFGADLGSSVWYRYDARQDTVLVADTFGTDYDNVLTVWTESQFGLTSKEGGCSTSFGPSGGARVAVRAEGGQSYYFQIGSAFFGPEPQDSGRVVFHLDFGNPPANDDFAGREETWQFPFTSSVDTRDATIEVGEPRPSCSFGGITSTVWYTFKAPQSGLVVADTRESDYFATLIGVYQGRTRTDLNEVACGAPTSGPARAAFRVEIGQRYYIQVGGMGPPDFNFEDAAGFLVFSLEFAEAAPNDNFADAITITSLPFTHGVDTVAATTEPGEPSPCGLKAATVWYRYTPSSTISVSADTFGSDYDTVLAVYRGTSLATLQTVRCNDDFEGLQSHVQFTAQAGTTYYFQAGGFAGSTGALTFNADLLGPPPACPAGGNDGFEEGAPNTNEIPCWSIEDQGGGSWCLQAGTAAPEGLCSGSGATVAAPPHGDQAAMTGQSEPGAHVLYRCFTLPQDATLSFQLYINNQGGVFASPETLGPNVFDNQQFRADVVLADALDDDPFTVDTDDVVNIYRTMPGDELESGYAGVVASIGNAWAGRDVCLRFAEVDNLGFFHAGIDDVQVHAAGGVGDVNCDGRVNSIDAQLILQYEAGLISSLRCQVNADVNGDGRIDSVDALLILQLEAGLIDSL